MLRLGSWATVFLKNVFSVYDGGFSTGQARVGFASLRGSSGQTVATTEGAIQASAEQTINQATLTSTSITTRAPLPTQFTSITGIVGGSGLPAPTPGTGVVSSRPSLINGNNGGSASSDAITARSPSLVLALVGFAAGLAVVF